MANKNSTDNKRSFYEMFPSRIVVRSKKVGGSAQFPSPVRSKYTIQVFYLDFSKVKIIFKMFIKMVVSQIKTPNTPFTVKMTHLTTFC